MEQETQGQTKNCPKCGEQIQSTAKVCKHCKADLRNWFSKHKILTGILILLVLIIISSGGKKSDSTSPTPDSNSNTQSNQQASTKSAKIGETVTDKDMAFLVQGIKTASSVGNQFTKKEAQGIYNIISVKIQNNGKETKTINASDFKIVDSQGRKYDYSQDGQIASEMAQGTTNLFLQQVQPSLSVNGNIVFDVPKDAVGLKLIAQGALFSDGVTIELGK